MGKTDEMKGPVVASNSPIKVELKEGETYHFCVCGRSASQPFCDGSHAGTGFSPRSFVAQSTGTARLCVCKHTRNAPFCDGTHNRFLSDDVGEPGPGVQK